MLPYGRPAGANPLKIQRAGSKLVPKSALVRKIHMNQIPAYPLFALLAFNLALGCVRAQFGPAKGSGGAGGAGGAGTCAEVTAIEGCVSSDDHCDPVCQTGDCGPCQKCTIAGDGTTVCAAYGDKLVGETCDINSLGTVQQWDDCVAGAICLSTPIPTAPLAAYCFTLCRSEFICSGVPCGTRPLYAGGKPVMVCDPEYMPCDPNAVPPCCNPFVISDGTDSNGCPPGRFCYLVKPDSTAGSTGRSRTVCEYSTGEGGRGTACTSSRDCLERLVCAPQGTCQRVCDQSNPCDGGADCIFMGDTYGYCPL